MSDPRALPRHSDGGLDVDAVARGLAELEHAMVERDRYRAALERIVREDRELFCNFCSAAEIAREALDV